MEGKKEQFPSFSAIEHAAAQISIFLLPLRPVGLGDEVGVALQRPVQLRLDLLQLFFGNA